LNNFNHGIGDRYLPSNDVVRLETESVIIFVIIRTENFFNIIGMAVIMRFENNIKAALFKLKLIIQCESILFLFGSLFPLHRIFYNSYYLLYLPISCYYPYYNVYSLY